jgi:hypothetical protein
MKYIGLMFASVLALGGMSSVVIAEDAQEALFVFPALEHLRHHDVPKVVRVRFSEDIERRTFRVWLNGEDVTDGIVPLPGEREAGLPFEVGRNKVVFSARRASRPDAAAEEARFTIRYRPPGDTALSGETTTLPDSPETWALVEEMMEAGRAGDIEKFLQIKNQLDGMGTHGK